MDHETLPYQLAQTAQRKAAKARRKKRSTPASTAVAGEPRLSPTQQAGREAENRASLYLQAQGLIVLDHNLSSKAGEIDLVANDHGTLVFIEVRQRGTCQYGGAAASVNRHKQRCLVNTALFHLPGLTRRFFHGHTPACRFDLVSIEPSGLTWIRHAFEA